MTDVSNNLSAVVVILNGYGKLKDLMCTCGYSKSVEYNERVHSCPKCGCERVFENYRNSLGEVVFTKPILETISKDDRHFHLKKQDVEVSASVGKEVKIKEVGSGEIQFTMKDKSFKLKLNGKEVYPSDSNINKFFKKVGKWEALKAMTTEKNRDLFDFCHGTLGRMGYERNKMWGRGLRRMKDFPAVEMFGLSPISNKLSSLWVGSKVLKTRDIKAPHKMLGVPKFLMKYIHRMNRFGSFVLEDLKALCDYFDGNSVRLIFEMFDNESEIDKIPTLTNRLIELHRDYGYKNLKRTLLYIVRETKLEQGISSPNDSTTLLRDYARMSKALEIDHDKYPKSLKKDHDIVLMNYKARESELKQKEFSSVVESEEYAKLTFKEKDFAITYPETVRDVIQEGDALSHCVASYVDDIIKKKCKILFLRKSDSLDESLATVEVRGDRVVQVKSRFNRRPSEDALEFVNVWASKKDLNVLNY